MTCRAIAVLTGISELFTLNARSHRDVAIGDDADEAAVTVGADHRHAAAVGFPHQLGGAVESVSLRADPHIACHELLDFHRESPSIV